MARPFLFFSGKQRLYRVIADPYEDGSVPCMLPVNEEADIVFCSREHFDHNARDLVTLRKNASSSVISFKFADDFHGMPDFLQHMPPAGFSESASVEIPSSCLLKPGIIIPRRGRLQNRCKNTIILLLIR